MTKRELFKQIDDALNGSSDMLISFKREQIVSYCDSKGDDFALMWYDDLMEEIEYEFHLLQQEFNDIY